MGRIMCIADVNSGTNISGALVFETASAGSLAERMRITSAGICSMRSATTTEFIQLTSTNNSTRAVIAASGKDSSGNAVTIKIGGFGDTSRGEIFTHSNHGLGFATNNSATQMTLDTGGRLLVGHTASLDQNAQIQSFTTGTDTFAGFKYGANASPNIIRLAKSRNASAGGNTIVADDDEIGRILFSGADGSDYNDCGALHCYVDGAPSSGTDMPGRLVLATSPDATGTM